jgi:hypothetical protein
MDLGVTRLLFRQANLFAEGRLREMTDSFVLPFPMQMEDRLMVMRDARDLVEALGACRRALLAAGATRFMPRVAAIELPRGGRFRAWVRWEHHLRPHAAPSGTSAIYYLHRPADRTLLIEMADHAALPAAEVRPAAPSRVQA